MDFLSGRQRTCTTGGSLRVRLKAETTYSEIAEGTVRRLAVRRACAHHNLDLSPFHFLFEHAEPRLLLKIENLVQTVLCLSDVGRKADIQIRQHLQPVLDQVLIDAPIRRVQSTAQLIEQHHALVLAAPANLLQGTQSRDESWILIVAQLQNVLRLHDDVGVEHLLNFARRDRLLAPRWNWCSAFGALRASALAAKNRRRHCAHASGNHDRPQHRLHDFDSSSFRIRCNSIRPSGVRSITARSTNPTPLSPASAATSQSRSRAMSANNVSEGSS